MAKNWAICIGINHYDYNKPLECGVNDAEKMKEFFSEAKFEKIYLFTDDSPPITDMSRDFPSQPTYTKISYWLGKRFNKKKKPLTVRDNLWFFFSGHGWRYRGEDYILLSDSNSDPDYIERTAIPIKEITNHLLSSGAGNIIMLLDACRDTSKAASIELEKEQGIIKIASCQPNELSYEIKPLKHGAFTFALLESLRLQGEGNCATLERLCNRLRNRVKELTWEYHKKTQIPYAAVEPETKYHLILLPNYIQPTQADLSRLREDALKAEIEGDLILAEMLWTRLVKFDSEEALKALRRIWSKSTKDPSELISSPTPISKSPTVIPSSDEIKKSKSTTNKRPSNNQTNSRSIINWPQIPWPQLPHIRVTRRQILKGMGWTGTGIGIIGLAKIVQVQLKPLPSAKTEKKGGSEFEFQFVTVNDKGEEIKRETSTARYIAENLGNDVTLDMVEIPGGIFMMGTEDAEIERLVKKFNSDYFRRERPIHQVSVSPFVMGKYPITQAQWKAIASLDKIDIDLKPDPSSFKGDEHPVTNITWHECVEFCKRLSKLTGKEYKLPSEAQWEYACRAGTTTPFYFGETITTDLANYNGSYVFASEPKGQYREETTPVGQFPPNAFGLYDLHGNVWEWCADDFHQNYEGPPKDGSVWTSNDDKTTKILRGGSWLYYPHACRSAFRLGLNTPSDYYGFRVVCVLPRR